jgi:hypothetical protein
VPSHGARLFQWPSAARQAVGQVFGAQRGLGGHHAAADIHADGCGDDGLDGGNHRADGGTNAQVHIGHGGDMFEDNGQARGVGQLLPGLGFHGHTLGPHLDGHAASDFQ